MTPDSGKADVVGITKASPCQLSFIPPSRWLWLITEALPRPRGFDPAEPMVVFITEALPRPREAGSAENRNLRGGVVEVKGRRWWR